MSHSMIGIPDMLPLRDFLKESKDKKELGVEPQECQNKPCSPMEESKDACDEKNLGGKPKECGKKLEPLNQIDPFPEEDQPEESEQANG